LNSARVVSSPVIFLTGMSRMDALIKWFSSSSMIAGRGSGFAF
jgi:hypothetical protein